MDQLNGERSPARIPQDSRASLYHPRYSGAGEVRQPLDAQKREGLYDGLMGVVELIAAVGN